MSDARILAFAGSTRGGSFNNRLVQIAEGGAREGGASVTHVDLRDYRLPLFDEDEEAAGGKPPAAKALKALMVSHHGFLVSAPEYNGSITGVLKNTIDWVSRPDPDDVVPLPAFSDKVVTLMSASPGALGGLRGLVHVRSIFGGLGCLVLPGQVAVAKAPDAFAEDGSLIDQRQQQRIVGLGRTLAETVAKLVE